jgi:hypothetical protein
MHSVSMTMHLPYVKYMQIIHFDIKLLEIFVGISYSTHIKQFLRL